MVKFIMSDMKNYQTCKEVEKFNRNQSAITLVIELVAKDIKIVIIAIIYVIKKLKANVAC